MSDGYEISTDRDRLDFDVIHGFLRNAYWSPGVPREVVERSVANSIPFGAYDPSGAQAGFARVVTDRAVFAYLADVFVLPEHRGHGVGVRLVEAVVAHPDLQNLRRFTLATRDAHGLYAKFGFVPLRDPTLFMTLDQAAGDIYPPR